MSTRRDTLGESAVRILASAGARGLTHRAVDRHADVPEGTTSRYARTRAALLAMAGDALITQDRQETLGVLLQDVTPITTIAAIADLLVRVTDTLMRAPERFRARVELQLEGARNPALRVCFEEARAAFAAPLAQILREVGYHDSDALADRTITLVDALLYRQLIAAEPALPAESMTALFTANLTTATGGPVVSR